MAFIMYVNIFVRESYELALYNKIILTKQTEKLYKMIISCRINLSYFVKNKLFCFHNIIINMHHIH